MTLQEIITALEASCKELCENDYEIGSAALHINMARLAESLPHSAKEGLNAFRASYGGEQIA